MSTSVLHDTLDEIARTRGTPRCERAIRRALAEIARGADSLAPDPRPGGLNRSALHRAVGNAPAEIVRAMVHAGADPADDPSRHPSLWHVAVGRNSSSILDALALAGPPPTNEHLVAYAALHGSDHALFGLHANGVDLNEPNHLGDRPLAIAMREGHLETVTTLLAFGADPGAHDRHGRNLWHALGDHDHANEPTIPRARPDWRGLASSLQTNGLDPWINARDTNGDTPAHRVARTPHCDPVLKRLETLGADLLATNATGETPLGIVAATANESELANLLETKTRAELALIAQNPPTLFAIANTAIERRHDAIGDQLANNWSSGGRRSASEIAATITDTDATLTELLDTGPDPFVRNPFTNTTLVEILATGAHDEHLARALDGARPAKTPAEHDFRRETLNQALRVSAGHANAAGCQTLLAHGADPTAPDDTGATALHIAVSAEPGHDRAFADHARRSTIRTLRDDDAVRGRTPPLEVRTNNENETPAMVALRLGDPALAQELLDGRGAAQASEALRKTIETAVSTNDRAKPRTSETVLGDPSDRALDAVVHERHHELESLLRHGLEVNQPIGDTDPTTLLHIAAATDNRTATRILLKHGADPRLRDRNDRTCGEVALGSAKPDSTLDLLLTHSPLDRKMLLAGRLDHRARVDTLRRTEAVPATLDSKSLLVGQLVAQGHPQTLAALIEETPALATREMPITGFTPSEIAAEFSPDGRRALEHAIALARNEAAPQGPRREQRAAARRREQALSQTGAEPGL